MPMQERIVLTERQREQDVAAMFKALGDPTRLRIFHFLRACCGPVAVEDSGDVRPVQGAAGIGEGGGEGPTVGEVCCRITGAERINSTISHHLKELRLAGLITVHRRGKNMICGVNHAAVERLTAYLSDKPDGTTPTDGCC